MSGYKLYYFPGRGRGETSRLSFAAANIEFEDIRLDEEAWAKEKACRYTSLVFWVRKLWCNKYTYICNPRKQQSTLI